MIRMTPQETTTYLQRNDSMTPAVRLAIACCLSLICLVPCSSAGYAQQWTAPTPEELSMTSQPEVPGAPAVYLFREEITDDRLHMWSKYVRLKVLSEAGKEYANVELTQYSSSGHGGYTVNGIAGRTIHPDGTIIPFTGKPMEKLVEKTQGFKEMAKVFTLPDVAVGSIIEYRYQLRYDDNYFFSPDWFVQSELYTRKAHYLWRPTDQQLVSKGEKGEQLTSSIAWTPILPKEFSVKASTTANTSATGNQQKVLELNVHDVSPAPHEEYMPPIGSLSYRVLFYYSPYRSTEEYWKNEGKGWAKTQDKFIGPDKKVKEAVNDLVAPGDTADQKLRKIYAAVMKLDNTAYSRDRSASEDKALGLGEPKSTDDIWERKRGSDNQMAQLFVAMARAAGMKAYVMTVTNRDRNMFVPGYLSLSQLDDTIAIVVIDGKEEFFDPGQRYCSYGHLAWKHTMASGLRQTDGGSEISSTPGEPYTASRIQRVANLNLDEHGEVTGTVKMTWIGDPALSWRHTYLKGDMEGLKRDLRSSVERLMPSGMDVQVSGIENIENYEQPLIVEYVVKGPIASSTGKRLLVPADIFEVNAKPTFLHEKREEPIFFNYAHMVQDAVRVNYPASLAVESEPVSESFPMQKRAVYMLKTENTPTSFTVRREFDLGTIGFKQEDYPDLRAFYRKLETKDQEPVVLKLAPSPASASN
jgi:transglutaminase-like putative cysteine protease